MKCLLRTCANVILLGLMTTWVEASAVKNSEDKFPLGCKDLGYQFELKVLRLLPATTADRQSLYFMYNRQGYVSTACCNHLFYSCPQRYGRNLSRYGE